MAWNTRGWTAGEQKRLRDIADLHALSLALLRELGSELTVPPSLARIGLPDARRLDSAALESLLDEREAVEVLEDTWSDALAFHLGAVEEVATKRHAHFGERRILNAAWDEGRAAARLRWADMPASESLDLRHLFSALSDSAVEPALVRRSTATELDLELNHCPHSRAPALAGCDRLKGQTLDLLCQIHRAYRQGFVQALNPRVRASATSPAASGRGGMACTQALRL